MQGCEQYFMDLDNYIDATIRVDAINFEINSLKRVIMHLYDEIVICDNEGEWIAVGRLRARIEKAAIRIEKLEAKQRRLLQFQPPPNPPAFQANQRS